MTDKNDPREIILKAAAERIVHYGYNKTTMSEIAADCEMSAGNIYRFFPSKIDIANEMTRRFDAELHQSYEAILGDAARSPSRKLADLFELRLERTFHIFERYPKLMELAEIMRRERPDYSSEERAQERTYICRILQEGADAGEFALPYDLKITADLVQAALVKFLFPQFWTTEQLESLKIEKARLLTLLLTGLAARS
ncbi:MAG: TetR/AcrR family transcriptional regulator [Hyphomonadaceae bacterium]